MILTDGKFRTKDYGNAILVGRVAEDLGIPEDLSRSFGPADKPKFSVDFLVQPEFDTCENLSALRPLGNT